MERVNGDDVMQHKGCEMSGSLDYAITPPSGGGKGGGSAGEAVETMACLWRGGGQANLGHYFRQATLVAPRSAQPHPHGKDMSTCQSYITASSLPEASLTKGNHRAADTQGKVINLLGFGSREST